MLIRDARVEAEGKAHWARQSQAGWELLSDAPWLNGAPTGVFLESPRFLAPVIPGKIIAIGSNYRDHAAEMGKPVPSIPKIFFKPPSSIIGPFEPIVIPPRTTRVDHEAELGVIIGRQAIRVPIASAMDFVWGYTLVNDVTARDFQAADGVFARAKGFDSFCPTGPFVVRGLDPSSLGVRCRVDGVLRQNSSTRDMVFDVATLIAFISDIMTLHPGDLISTGTPAGVGPIVAGQVVEVEIDGLGSLSNPVINRDDR